jgi:hypothetical protein
MDRQDCVFHCDTLGHIRECYLFWINSTHRYMAQQTEASLCKVEKGSVSWLIQNPAMVLTWPVKCENIQVPLHRAQSTQLHVVLEEQWAKAYSHAPALTWHCVTQLA